MIAWFSAGHFSHVDAVVPTPGGPDALLGARADRTDGAPPGVWVRDQGYADFATRVVFEIPADGNQETLWRSFLASQIGKPYDREAIWAFAFGRDWREPDSWVCSELQARALEVAGISDCFYLACNKITPVALALAISAMGAKVVESEGV